MILNRQRSVRLPLRVLEIFLRRLMRELRLGHTPVTVCLVGDAEIARMNQQFRKKRGLTDVLSFPTTKRRKTSKTRPSRRSNESLGDIAVAPAVAKRNARSYGRSLPTEMKILILHGVLHLLGYDHETDRGEMERKEQKLRRRLGLA